jgi:hypothetical protein
VAANNAALAVAVLPIVTPLVLVVEIASLRVSNVVL